MIRWGYGYSIYERYCDRECEYILCARKLKIEPRRFRQLMFSVTVPLLWHKSKRIVVKLVSAAQTGFYYVTEKSASKKDYRMALRKHDPLVNQHVVFYEQKALSTGQAHKLMRKRSIRNMRFTGKRIEQLVKQHESKSNRLMGTLYLF